MTALADEAARCRALTDLSATLLVEAAAGTGKTSLMAGRLVMLLASGIEPGQIAAITFTELAAGELGVRVRRFIDQLLRGDVPRDLRLALPEGLRDQQRDALMIAQAKLDELTTTTIHGFCQALFRGYAVEADIDPGARILDAGEANDAFDRVFEQWLKRRLGTPAPVGDAIVTLSRSDPRGVAVTLKELAEFKRRHRTAATPQGDLDRTADHELRAVVDEFRRWLASTPGEQKTSEDVAALEQLATFYAGAFDPLPDFGRLWELAHPPKVSITRGKTFDLGPYKCLGLWQRVNKENGRQLNDQATALYGRAANAFRTLLGRVATALVAALSGELDEVMEDFAAFKRTAAVLDFDDLLLKARDLVRTHEVVRHALSQRYRYIFVDEFQDTDPVQAEALFRLAGGPNAPGSWRDIELRPGALFLVGDPKQAIYQFRGANIASYVEARDVVERCFPGNTLAVASNFRSRPQILAHVNKCFDQPLSAPGQPGYVSLSATLSEAEHGLPATVKVSIAMAPNPRADEIRETEAAAVADICRRLIGNLHIRNGEGELVPLAPGHIALLAPTGADLWRYERALEDLGLPVASQAGKGHFRRQEVQDLIALARILADPRDTAALGALLRGPLVGASDEELLDIAAALPTDAPILSVSTDPEAISHPVARQVIILLQDLRRRVNSTTPVMLLSEAVERLNVRTILSARSGDRNSRALANVDAFLERTRRHGTRGIKQLVRDLHADWSASASQEEGRVDPDGEAIELITMHSAKGLEWPVVIPINSATQFPSRRQFVHRKADDSLHWVIGDVVPPGLADALQSDGEAVTHERTRLWYVACTRARELLVVPHIPVADRGSWSKLVNLAHDELPELDLSGFAVRPLVSRTDAANQQTSELFTSETAQVRVASPALVWRRPSDHDADRLPAVPVASVEADDPPELVVRAGAGRLRGNILHKLMEEILTGELAERPPVIQGRAAELLLMLMTEGTGELPEPGEMAAAVISTLALPDIVTLRTSLVPEYSVFASLTYRGEETLMTGRADALAIEAGEIRAVLDWKSDINPSPFDRLAYADQVRSYMEAAGAPRGAIVYMSRGEVQWIEAGDI